MHLDHRKCGLGDTTHRRGKWGAEPWIRPRNARASIPSNESRLPSPPASRATALCYLEPLCRRRSPSLLRSLLLADAGQKKAEAEEAEAHETKKDILKRAASITACQAIQIMEIHS